MRPATTAVYVCILQAFCLSAVAAPTLPIDRSGVVAALKDAAGRIGTKLDLVPTRCGDNGDNCRWSAGDGVDLSVTTLGAAKVYQLEAGWNNGNKASSAQSLAAFKNLCQVIVAAVRPSLERSAVAKLASKLELLRPIKGDHLDVEDRQHDAVFYGSRNVPDSPDFPTEAFVQCGVVANVENP